MRCCRYTDAATVASSHRCSKQAVSNFLPPGVFLEHRVSGAACSIWFFSAVLRTTLIAGVAAAREETCLAPALLGVAFFTFFAFFFLFLEATLLLASWRDAGFGMAPKRNTRNRGEQLFVATAAGIIARQRGRECKACDTEAIGRSCL